MNDLEIAVLCLLKFNLFVSPQSYDLYKDSLAAPLRGSTHFKTSRTKIIQPESSPLPPPSNDEIPPPPIDTAPASPITTPNNSNSINITNQFQFTVFTHTTGTSPNTNSSTSNANSASATPTQTELSISSLTCCVGAALQSATRLSPSPSKVAPTKPQLSYHKGPQWLSPYSSKSKRNKSPPSPNSNDS
ncbi:hypothetical protein Pelo_9465 [Pelomyxa schiedti]|nr:hypothetical protein Pelo_9465 [Pelomyxa schiedti]